LVALLLCVPIVLVVFNHNIRHRVKHPCSSVDYPYFKVLFCRRLNWRHR